MSAPDAGAKKEGGKPWWVMWVVIPIVIYFLISEGVVAKLGKQVGIFFDSILSTLSDYGHVLLPVAVFGLFYWVFRQSKKSGGDHGHADGDHGPKAEPKK